MRPKVEAWDHRVCTLAKTAKKYPHSAYAVFGMSLQLEWKYPQRTVPGVGSLMGPIEDALKEAFFPALFGEEKIRSNLREILGHCVKQGGICIPDPRMSEERAYNISKADSEVLLGSLLGHNNIN